jgi:3-hydroxyisobutyrate dehydrogenase
MNEPRIGFIGLGLMGSPICMKLIENGFPVSVWGRTPEKLAPALLAGATLADTPRSLAERSEIVMLCVTDASAVEDVVFGRDGVAAGATAGDVLIDHSSIRPAATREMAAKLLKTVSMHWIDAPVSGGAPGVMNKTLVVMCGGDQKVFDQVRPVIDTYAGRCTRMGAIGAGQTTKLFNQALCGIAFVATAEVTALARRAGVDAAAIPGALAGGRADSRVLQEFMPRMLESDGIRSGRIDTMVKDLLAVAELAAETGARIPCTNLAAAIHGALVDAGIGAEDPAAIVKFFE